MADDLETIKLQNEIEMLDREWTMEVEKLKVSGKNGTRSVPSTAGAVATGVVAVLGGGIFIAFSAGLGAPGFMPVFGLVFIAIGLVGCLTTLTKAREYQRRREDYEYHRRELMEKLRGRAA